MSAQKRSSPRREDLFCAKSDDKIAGDRAFADFVHAFFDGQMGGMGLVGIEGGAVGEQGHEAQIVAALAAEEIRAGLEGDEALHLAEHGMEASDELRDVLFVFGLDPKEYDVADHGWQRPFLVYFPKYSTCVVGKQPLQGEGMGGIMGHMETRASERGGNGMTDDVRQIALRIRELRESLEKQPEQIAAQIGVDVEDYQRYENGEVDIPISFLLKLEKEYGVDPTTILTGQAPRLSVCAVTRKDMGVTVSRAHHYSYKNLAYNFNHRKAEPLHVTVNPGVNEQLETNAHDGHEFDYVISGMLRLVVGSNDIILHPGDSAYYDSNHPHAMQAVGSEPCHFLAIVIP